ncbi:hypothetical protein XELAEV_18020953mg [Xenopus laevis]|uniref:Uncharacterized protein n=1 Tax=Xenopus laevis TaxID=8355 RepID=A0A974DAH9_XENLA|nr:hypothetical protein XELAEV_18020953mg [Xenopus laevis]
MQGQTYYSGASRPAPLPHLLLPPISFSSPFPPLLPLFPSPSPTRPPPLGAITRTNRRRNRPADWHWGHVGEACCP